MSATPIDRFATTKGLQNTRGVVGPSSSPPGRIYRLPTPGPSKLPYFVVLFGNKNYGLLEISVAEPSGLHNSTSATNGDR